MYYMGIDHHRQCSHITLLDEKGEGVKSGKVANYRRELERFLEGIGDVKAVIEAGRSSYTMVDVLDDLGIETKVAHPKEVRAIAKAKVKTDERDSWKLAHLFHRRIWFSAAVAEWAFIRQFCLLPSSGMINLDVQGCQVKLEMAEGGL